MSFNDYIYWQTLKETGKTPEEIYEYNHPEVVRCKECVHGTWHKQTEMYICSANDQDLYEAEHFCSYGERKEGE